MVIADRRFVSLGSRLKGVPEVETLGVRPNFLDYTQEERDLILNADLVLFPTLNYAQFLSTSGRKIFPSLETYLYADEKIKQTTLFYMLGIPHPRTRIYFRRHHHDILNDFTFPFVAKIPRCSARGRGVFMIDGKEALEAYLKSNKIAYIQEYIPHQRDLRVVLINYQPILAYWRIPCKGNFRSNLAQGGTIDFDHIPEEGVMTARDAARKCRLNDVGIDLIHSRGLWHVMEANMKYGRKGLTMKGLDLKEIIREALLSGELG
ncbi:MAG: RimK family alpha-L-glutamate ligase [Deltaproteobacteria bacterium]|nr:RimK family alpha-L-glutamate ligase [Deltaproteobacteria bacterium]